MEDFLSVFIFTFSIMVLAEFGDKTNLIALSLMTKSKHPYRIALFSTIGIGLSTVISVLIGGIIGQNLPVNPIRYIAAAVFIVLGIISLREEDEEKEEISEDTEKDKVPFYKPIYLVALAEFGDKSQLFAITASASTSPLAVFLGSVLGMGTIMFLTAAFGSLFFEKFNRETLEKLAAILFIVAGIWIAISTFFEF